MKSIFQAESACYDAEDRVASAISYWPRSSSRLRDLSSIWNHIKGICDTRSNDEKICVTGSSRLNIYRRGGDSLLGRYHYFTLHPFSLKEWSGSSPSLVMPQKCHDLVFDQSSSACAELLKFGGFPEPLLDGRERTLLRWQNERFERIFREDIL